MWGEAISSFCAGSAMGFSISSPVEWKIHKDLLHAPPRLRRLHPFVNAAAAGHNDNHHAAYRAPEHYYRDVTNESEVIHFARSDVGLIAASSAFVGASLERTHALLTGDYSFGQTNIAFVAGIFTGAMAYYGGYELFHHYMHVIGERRLTINRELGDAIQGGRNCRDSNLRLSKPLLDDICTMIEEHIDRRSSEAEFLHCTAYHPELVQRLNYQIQENVEKNLAREKPKIVPKEAWGTGVLSTTYCSVAAHEQRFRETLNLKENAGYFFRRMLQRTLRTSLLFKELDNHHFVHHRKYGANLNVLVPLMDYLRGTKEDSSSKILEENRNYWLCPNSPDETPFERKAA